MSTAPPRTGYAPVNGLELYYEVHGGDERPLVLLHGAYGTTELFMSLIAAIGDSRQVITVDLQGHGRTADIDRPLTIGAMAEDVAGLLAHLGVSRADVFGYSMGAGVGLQLAISHPELVLKLVVESVYTKNSGAYPEILAGFDQITPEMFAGTPFEAAYQKVAPRPENFATLVKKLTEMDTTFPGWDDDQIRDIAAPTLIIVGDGDIVRPEHAVELFRLRGGGVPADLTGGTAAQLAILPGTTHITAIDRTEWLASMVTNFLDHDPAPPMAPEAAPKDG